MPRRLLSTLVAALGLAACADASVTPTAPDTAGTGAIADAGVLAATRVTAAATWNQRTRAIIGCASFSTLRK